MQLYVESWEARPAWLKLCIQDRIAYLDRMSEAIDALRDAGARLVGVVTNEGDAPPETGIRYVAVWWMPEGASHIQMLEEALAALGWHEYFVSVPARGVLGESRTFFEYAEEGGAPGERLVELSSVRKN